MIQNSKFKIQNSNKGFTLMEVILAIAVITTALVATMALISFSLSAVGTSKSRVIATHLGQEGLEIVRNIRDSNWLADKKSSDTWRDGLAQGDYRTQYNQSGLLAFDDVPLKIDSSGFYQYDSGSNTLFYRKITIEHIGDNQIKASAEITWQEKGKSHSFVTEDRFYNWLEE